MAVPLTDEVTWLPACHEVDGGHLHVSTYLVAQDDPAHTFLVDTGAVEEAESVVAAVEGATAGRGLDTLVLSHPDLPHAGNVQALRERWPDADLVVFSNTPPIHGLGDAVKADRGGESTIAGRRFSWIDAPLADITSTAWVYDHDTDVLFAADGFGHYHRPGQCTETSRNLDGEVDYDDVRAFNVDVLAWLKYADPAKLRRKLGAFFDAYEVSWVAPIHGSPIHRDDLDDHLDLFYRAAEDISASYVYPENRT